MTRIEARIDFAKLPPGILSMFIQANSALRESWTLSERLLEIIRLHSAFEHECHT